jgi:fused signal recognition particle receptor
MEILVAASAVLVVVVVLIVVLLVRRSGPGRDGPGPGGPERSTGDGRADERVGRAEPSIASGTAVLDVPPTSPGGLGARVRRLLGSAPTHDEWRELEGVLIRADVGARAAADLVARVKARFDSGSDPARLLRDEIVSLLGPASELGLSDARPAIVIVVGVNGAGKSTTIGKLAARLHGTGKRVMLANSDTFRAAAGEQLGIWAQRAGVQIVAQERGADPGSVAFDAVSSANAKGCDVLIIDTAGRLHTKAPLMDELGKVRRVTEKAAAQTGGSIDEILLVLDAQTGQNGIAQARAFTEAVDVTGVVLTKMDGSARGGIVLVVREELGVPVKLVGVGESIDDLETFDPSAFADRLLESDA